MQAQAREKAIENAEEKARELASQLGKSLGKLKGFTEGGVAMPMYARDAVMMESVGVGGAKPTPVPEGEQEIQANVSLTYELR